MNRSASTPRLVPKLVLMLLTATACLPLGAHATVMQDQSGNTANNGVKRFTVHSEGSQRNRFMDAESVRRARYLAATLDGFDMITRETNALLRWSTIAEQNNAGFEVEYRLVDVGMEFEAVGFVAGAGYSEVRRTYRFGVKNLVPGTHEFRLKITARDGTTTLTEPVRVDVNSGPEFALGESAHDPATGVVYIPYTLDRPGIVRLILVDADGRLVDTLAFGTHEAGTHVAYFDARRLEGRELTIELHTEHGSTTRPACFTCHIDAAGHDAAQEATSDEAGHEQ